MAWTWLTQMVEPIAGVFKARTELKKVTESGKQKVLAAQVDGTNSLQLSDSEWEALNSDPNNNGWKDEYVTIIGTIPYNLVVVGAILAAFGNDKLLEGALLGIKTLNAEGIPVGFICESVVLAAIGLKVWRNR